MTVPDKDFNPFLPHTEACVNEHLEYFGTQFRIIGDMLTETEQSEYNLKKMLVWALKSLEDVCNGP